MKQKLIANFLLVLLGVLPCRAVTIYSVAINTTAWSGLSGTLAFDLIGGDATVANNTATIGSFATNGTLGSTDSFALSDMAYFNEVLRGITFGTHLNFTLQLTENHTAPGFDQFSFFLLDPNSQLPLGPTTDPTGANALFAIDMTGSAGGNAMVFASAVSGTSWTLTNKSANSVPDAGSPFGLAVCGLVSIVLFKFAFRARPPGVRASNSASQ